MKKIKFAALSAVVPLLCFGQEEGNRYRVTATFEVSGHEILEVDNSHTEAEELAIHTELAAAYPLGREVEVTVDAPVSGATELSEEFWLLGNGSITARWLAGGIDPITYDDPQMSLFSTPHALRFYGGHWRTGSIDITSRIPEPFIDRKGLDKFADLSDVPADDLPDSRLSFPLGMTRGSKVVELNIISFRTEIVPPEPPGPPAIPGSDIILEPNGPTQWTQFGGTTLVANGNWMAVGSRTEGVRMYELNEAGAYKLRQVLRCPDGDQHTGFGSSLGNNIAIQGPYMVIGATGVYTDAGNYTGAAYLYEQGPSGWSLLDRFSDPLGATFDAFGHSVDVYFDFEARVLNLIVGAMGADDNGSLSGAAYVFEYAIDGGVFSQIARILPQDGGGESEWFGNQVAINKTRYAISAFRGKHDQSGIEVGAVYTGKLDSLGANSITETKLLPGPEAINSNARFGHSIDMSDDVLVAGGYLARNHSLAAAGAVYAYDLNTPELSVTKLVPTEVGFALGHYFGHSVALDGNHILTASHGNPTFGTASVGIGHLYRRDLAGNWNAHSTLIPSRHNDYQNYGYKVALSATRAVLAAPRHNADGVDQAGAVFVEPVDRSPATATLLVDYSLDETGFFSDRVEGPYRRAQREWAARRVSDYVMDQLDEIRPDPSQGHVWNPVILKPSVSPDSLGQPGTYVEGGNLVVPKNIIRVFVGGFPFDGSYENTAAITAALPENLNFLNLPEPASDWAAAVNHRGQSGMNTTPRSDTSVWGRTVSFNSQVDWLDNDGTWEPEERSLYRTAMHEFLHVLGYSSVDESVSAFMSYYDASGEVPRFTGPFATIANSGVPPEMANSAHLGPNLVSTLGLSLSGPVQSVLMRPSAPNGIQEFPTFLDLALLQDIGWEVDLPIQFAPEPEFLQGAGGAFPMVSIAADQLSLTPRGGFTPKQPVALRRAPVDRRGGTRRRGESRGANRLGTLAITDCQTGCHPTAANRLPSFVDSVTITDCSCCPAVSRK